MGKGRKKTPDNIKIIRGTFRDDRANKNVPTPDNDVARSPSWLPVEAREYFGVLKERLDGINLASRTYTEMLAMAAQRLAEIEHLNKIIFKEGQTYISTKLDKNGEPVVDMVKPHPAVAQRSEAMRHLQSLLSEFGLSPAAVGKVSVSDASKKTENPYKKYKNA